MKLKKVLAFVLCVAMVLSTMSFNVFAAEGTTDAAKIGDASYQSLADALEAAKGMTGEVTVEIYDKVTLNNGLSGNYSSIKFVGKAESAEIYLDVQGYITATGKAVAFEDLKLSKSAGGYIANAGFMNVAFGVYDVDSVSYTSCTFLNGAYASSGDVTFTGCTFYKSNDKYGLWAYGDVNAVVDGCVFADYRGIKMYAEGAAKTTNLTVKDTDFSAVTNKPAIVLTYGESVTLEGNNYSSTGVFELDKAGAPNGTTVTSTDAITCINDNGACGVLVDGKIYTKLADAAAVAVAGDTVTLLHDSDEAVTFEPGVTLVTNDYKAPNATVPVTVAMIGTEPFTSLNEALAKAGKAGAGDTTVDIVADVDLKGFDWTPVYVDGYHGADIVTVNGNGHKITNLSAPLFKGGFAGGSGIIINDLTIVDSTIVSTSNQGSGAFIECVDSMNIITLNNCHLLNSSVSSSHAKSSRAGGLIGWTSGYSKQNDGPVKTYVTVTDCSVVGCTITGTSVGAINGHAGASDWTYTTIENCIIKDNDLISVDDGGWRVGVVVGTANVGEVTINNIEESGNTLTQGSVTAKEGQTNLIGRYVPGSTGKLVIDGVAYTSDFKPYAATIKDDSGIKGYATVADALAAIKDGSVMTIYEGTYTDSLKINKANVTVKASGEVKFTDAPAFTGSNYYAEGIDFEYNTGSWNINGSGTIKDCNFKATKNAFRYGYANGDITFDNCSIVAGVYAIHFDSGNGSVTFKDCELSGFCAFGNGLTEAKFIGTKFFKDETSGYHHINLWGNSTLENCVFTPEFTADTCLEDIVVTVDDCTVTDGSSVADRFGDVSEQEGELYIDGECVSRFIMIDNEYYASLTQAILAAQPGGEIKLTGNITEKVLIEALAPAVAALASNDDAIVIDLAGYTLNGYILIEDSSKVIEIKNGNIVNEDCNESAIESNATLTVTNVNITSARHAINIEGTDANNKAIAYINGGNFTLIPYGPGRTQNAIGVENAVVTINGGVFTGPKGTTTDSGAAVAAKDGAEVTINGGKFSGGKNNTLSENATATLVVNGGSFDQDVSAFVADGKELVKLGDDAGYAYPYIIAPKAASAINVELAETATDGLYDIILVSSDGNPIHGFVAAQFTFKNDSETFGGSEMQFTVSGYTDANNLIDTVAQKTVVDGEERYIIRIKDAEKVENRLKGHSLTIGQVKFIGQGTINFSIANGEVDTTWQNTNLGRYYTVAEDTLNLVDATIVNGSVADITKNVAIKVTYNHDLVAAWDNDKITVTLKDAYGVVVGTDDISDGEAKFDNVKIGRITVTLEAPGFRKFVYETTLDEDDDATVVLSFWNDVKKEAYKLPIEKGATPVECNFVVGDIVMDYIVDKYDLAAVTSYYGMYGIKDNAKYIKYDLNRDGDIDIRDVQYVLHTMGK